MNSPTDSSTTPNIALSFREKQLVRLIRQAKSNKDIGCELNLTTGTVKEYVARIFRKLGVTNRTELAIWGCTHQEALAADADAVAA